MLTLFLLFTFSSLVFNRRIITYSFFCFFIFIYYLTNLNLFFNSTISSNIDFIVNDEIRLFMRFLLFFIMYISFLSANQFKRNISIRVVFLALLYVCFQVFNTRHLFSLYFFYEASLIPILYIIIK